MSIIDYIIDPCFTYYTVIILNFIIKIINFFTSKCLKWTFSYGFNSDYEKSQNCFESSCQIVDVLLFGTLALFHDVQLERNFFWKHNKYVHPNYILIHDNVTLYGFAQNHAFFCVSDHDVDVHDIENFPFQVIGQKVMCKKLIVIKLEYFHQLAKKIGDPPGRKVGFVQYTSRSGSTLLSQVINKVPGTRIINDPMCLLNIQRFHLNKVWTEDKTEICVKDAVRFLCKPLNGKKIDFTLIKWLSLTNRMIPLAMNNFPTYKWIFLTRTVKPALKSVAKLGFSYPWFYQWSDIIYADFHYNHLTIDDRNEEWKKVREEVYKDGYGKYTFTERMGILHGAQTANFDLVKNRLQMVMFYDDMIASPREMFQRVFDIYNLNKKYLEYGLTAMDVDSQKGLTGGIGTKQIVISDKEFARIDEIYKRVGLPLRTDMTLDSMRKIYC